MNKLEIAVIGILSLTGISMTIACSSGGEATGVADEGSATMTLEREPSAAPVLAEADRSLGFRCLHNGGWMVDEIVPGSPADSAGIRPGDRLISIGEVPAEAMSRETFEIYRALISKGSVDLAIEREGETLALHLEAAPSQSVFPGLFDSSVVPITTCFTSCLDPSNCFGPTPFGGSCGTCFTCTSL
jgi:membrane-associated protease RseP (regulator of RpoE activity)